MKQYTPTVDSSEADNTVLSKCVLIFEQILIISVALKFSNKECGYFLYCRNLSSLHVGTITFSTPTSGAFESLLEPILRK